MRNSKFDLSCEHKLPHRSQRLNIIAIWTARVSERQNVSNTERFYLEAKILLLNCCLARRPFLLLSFHKVVTTLYNGAHSTQTVISSCCIGRIEFFNSPDTKMEQVNCQLPSKKSLLIEFYSSVLSTYLNSSAAHGTYWEISHS